MCWDIKELQLQIWDPDVAQKGRPSRRPRLPNNGRTAVLLKPRADNGEEDSQQQQLKQQLKQQTS